MGNHKFAPHEGRSARTLAVRGATAVASSSPSIEHRGGWEIPTAVAPRQNGSSDRGASTATRSVPRGERVSLASTPGEPVTVVQSGWVALFRSLPGNRSICVGLLGPGDIFFHDRASTGNEVVAEALTDASLLQDEFQRVVGVLSGSAPLVQAALTSLRRQAADIQDLISRLLSRDITLRLAGVLIQLGERFGKQNPDGTTAITIPVAHKMLARMIGSNRVTVTRVMTEMRDKGLVRAPGRNQIVVDLDGLRDYLSRPLVAGDADEE